MDSILLVSLAQTADLFTFPGGACWLWCFLCRCL